MIHSLGEGLALDVDHHDESVIILLIPSVLITPVSTSLTPRRRSWDCALTELCPPSLTCCGSYCATRKRLSFVLPPTEAMLKFASNLYQPLNKMAELTLLYWLQLQDFGLVCDIPKVQAETTVMDIDWTRGSVVGHTRRENVGDSSNECAQPESPGTLPPRPEPRRFPLRWGSGGPPCYGGAALPSAAS